MSELKNVNDAVQWVLKHAADAFIQTIANSYAVMATCDEMDDYQKSAAIAGLRTGVAIGTIKQLLKQFPGETAEVMAGLNKELERQKIRYRLRPLE